jgi:hypothetical protein
LTSLRFRILAAALVAAALGSLVGSAARASAPDSLTLQTPTDVMTRSVYDGSMRRFTVWVTWREAADSCSAFVGRPDTTGWRVTTPPAQLSLPTTSGFYNGDIDRTVLIRSTRNAAVGTDSVRLFCEIRREEFLNTTVVLTPGYVPGTPVPVRFRDQRNNGAIVDLGLRVALGPGRVDAQGGFAVALEDFDGFHIWRGLEPDGSDLTVIGELSKEEAYKGAKTGGNFADSVYFYSVLPTLRTGSPWFSQFGAVDCLGTRIDLDLDADELFWYDCDARNGFTYYYAVTTYDRDYNPGSSSQGLVKRENCEVITGAPWSCRDQLVELNVQVENQNDLYRVYAVPNPYRSGGSRLTSENYHNFPDQFIRFVNVPTQCMIKIFTVAGDLVWEYDHNGGGNVEWDVTNRNSDPVTSGVYVYKLEAPSGESVYGRIVVIR